MKNKFIRAATGLLALAMLAGATTTGCVKKTSGPTSSATAPQNKTYKITWIGAQNQPLSSDPVLIKHWNQVFNVDIQYWNIDPNSWDQVLATKFAGGEIPDVLYCNSPTNFSNYVDQKLLAEIPQSMLNQYMPKTIAALKSDYPKIMSLAQKDGKQYAIPIGTYFHNQYHEPIVYRGDWMKKVGVTSMPKTLEQWEDLMYKFTNNDPDGNGKKDTYGLSSTAMDMVYGAFGLEPKQWNDVKGKLVYSSIQPEMKKALTVLAKMYKDGVIDPEFITGENKGGYWAISHAFCQGHIGLSEMGAYYHWMPNYGPINPKTGKTSVTAGADYQELEKNFPGAGKELIQGTPVTGPDGKSGVVGYALPHPASVGFGIQLEKEPDKMAKIMQMYEYWTADQENYFTARMGFKDQMWSYSSDGVPLSTFDDWKKANNKPNETLPGLGGQTVLEPFLLTKYDKISNKYLAEWTAANKYDKGSIRSELLITLPSASKYQTDLDKMEDEAYIAIITGKQPVSYFDTFVKEYKQSGYEIMAKEANDWYTAFNKK